MAQGLDTSVQKTTRRLWDADFLSHRPAGAKTEPVRPASAQDAYVGVTVWRLRPSANTVDEWTPERVSSGTPLLEGEKIRISIESARAGYVYVIDRGLASYRRTSDPVLIFPAQGGEQRIAAGSVVTLPRSGEKLSYFELKHPFGQIYEQFTILISPRPIPVAKVLQRAQVEEWESKWRVPVKKLEQPWMAGQEATAAEVQAHRGGIYPLTQDDPLPQDLYHSEARSGDPLLVQVLLTLYSLPEPPRQTFGGHFGLGGTSGVNSRRRVTASSFLVPIQSEAGGYGLYSYILFGSRPEALGSDRWRRYYEAILSFLTIQSADEMSRYARPADLNITFLPITCAYHELPRDSLQPRAFFFDKDRQASHAMEHQADGTKFSGHSLSNATTACTLVSNYDYPRAQKLLSVFADAHMEGPYIISVTQPLGNALTLPAEYLYQDLSSVPPELIGLWLREFMAQAQEREFWKSRTKELFVLKLRTAISIVSQQIPDFGSRITWALGAVTPPK